MADNEKTPEQIAAEEAKKAADAEKKAAKAAEKAAKAAPERVEIFIPRGAANEDANLFVSVNGKNYLIPRGKTSVVPAEVADEIERAREAQETADETKDRLLSQQ